MGIQIASLTLNSDISLTNVYARLNNVSGDKNMLHYSLNYYVSRDSDKAGKSYVKQSPVYDFVPSTDANSLRWDKQAYEDAKLKPEFAGATDILE